MSTSLLILVAVGAQDVYLTGNPEITLFKSLYKRHTNFSKNTLQLQFNSSVSFGNTSEIVISRKGDLVSNMYLKLEIEGTSGLENEWHWVENIGYRLINSIELQIGGQKIDKHYGDYLEIYDDISLSDSKKKILQNLVNPNHHSIAHPGSHKKTVLIPLRFWFNKYNKLPLPLISLQYHEVKLIFKIKNADPNLVEYGSNSTHDTIFKINNAQLLTDYIFLDNDERKKFAQNSHEYLIEQIQYDTQSLTNHQNKLKMKLNFNHPCKYLMWHIPDKKYIVPSTVPKNTIEEYNSTKVTFSNIYQNDASHNAQNAAQFMVLFAFRYWKPQREDKIRINKGCKIKLYYEQEPGNTTDVHNISTRIVPAYNNFYATADTIYSSPYASSSLGDEFKKEESLKLPDHSIFPESDSNNKKRLEDLCHDFFQHTSPKGYITITNQTGDDIFVFDQSVPTRYSSDFTNILTNYVKPDHKFIHNFNMSYNTKRPQIDDLIFGKHKISEFNETIIGIYDIWSTKPKSSDITDFAKNSVKNIKPSHSIITSKIMNSANIKLNGQDLFEQDMSDLYFTDVQVLNHFNNTSDNSDIYLYSFAINPLEHQPSGTCNFSRIDNCELILNLADHHLDRMLIVYAVNYNVLRIMSGMGGLAYSN